MKSVLRTLRHQSCRTHKITENEKETFSNYHHLQRYHPAIDMFSIPESALTHKHLALPSKYSICEWLQRSNTNSKVWTTTRKAASTEPETCQTFVKVVHLLDPIDMIKEKYTCPEHPLLPQSEKTWKETLLKLHSHNNQAYVDNVANFVLSRFRELNLTPHCILYYGCATGISKSYQFNISNEFYTYRQCRWFWKGMKSHSAKLVISKPDHDIESLPNYEEIYKEITTCPFDDETMSQSDPGSLEIELEPLSTDELTVDSSDLDSVHSFTFDTIEERADNVKDMIHINKLIVSSGQTTPDDKCSELGSDTESCSDESEGSNEEDNEDSGSDSDETVELDMDISLEMPNMPIIMIYQEAQEGVMDELLDEDELDGHERGSQGWEARWLAWLFQVIAVLCFLQKAICFTHNDLHSNNIVWRTTKQKFLYYRNRQGTIWRVPTFGKMFSIIDFGRSIFRLGSHLWVSDDHWPNQDAGDQYNFGPFFDPTKPKHPPNPSFDLSRLAVSLIDGLFDERPPKKKGKTVSVMSEEGSWKMYETNSPLFNLLWSWTVDDKGHTIYEDKHGNDKYEGFDLYIRIAQDVHNAVPCQQIHRPMFEQFKWKQKVDKAETIYSLGC
jgi:hypothetical protein